MELKKRLRSTKMDNSGAIGSDFRHFGMFLNNVTLGWILKSSTNLQTSRKFGAEDRRRYFRGMGPNARRACKEWFNPSGFGKTSKATFSINTTQSLTESGRKLKLSTLSVLKRQERRRASPPPHIPRGLPPQSVTVDPRAFHFKTLFIFRNFCWLQDLYKFQDLT